MTVFFLCVMAAVSLWVILTPNVYRSEAEMLVRIGRENASAGPTVATGKMINVSQERENEINSEADILKSRELAQKVVKVIGPELILHGAKETLPPEASLTATIRYFARRAVIYPLSALSKIFSPPKGQTAAKRVLQTDSAITSFMKQLSVDVSKKSNIISITYKTNDPGLARRVLDRLVGFYLEKHIEVNRTAGSYAFFKKQQSDLETLLDKTDEKLKALKNKTSIASITDQRRILLERIGEMKKQLGDIEASAAASKARVVELRATLAKLPSTVRKDMTTGFANSAADGLRKQVYDLELKEQKLLSTFTKDSIPVQEIRRQIQEGKLLLSRAQEQNQVTTGLNVNYQKLELDLLTQKENLSSLEARGSAVRAQLRSAAQEMDNLNDAQVRFERLSRAQAIQRANFSKYSDSLEQARINEALDVERISNISIVEPATYSLKPILPKRALDLAMGLFIALFGSLGLAFFCELQDHSIKKPEDVVSRLHMPMLGSIPFIGAKNSSKGALLSPPGSVEKTAGRGAFLGQNGNGAGLFELLSLLSCGPLGGHRAIALTSCHPQEGVTTASAFIAAQIAQRGEGRILLIDANCPSPGQHILFGTKLSPGLADLGNSPRSALTCIQPTSIECLDMLCAGNNGQRLAAASLKTFSECLPLLRREYSIIICDLPALLENSPAMQIASLVDGVVLVVEAEKTRWEVIHKAKDTLGNAGANVFGVLLNKRRLPIPEWLYKRL
jgi:uncharacterized protein involved in exopolysaccharide biosynthesis